MIAWVLGDGAIADFNDSRWPAQWARARSKDVRAQRHAEPAAERLNKPPT